MANLLRRIAEAFSARKEYETALSRVAEAVRSGKLNPTDPAVLAIPIIDAGKWKWSPVDGVDAVELIMLAEEKNMPLETVNDLLDLLRAVTKKIED